MPLVKRNLREGLFGMDHEEDGEGEYEYNDGDDDNQPHKKGCTYCCLMTAGELCFRCCAPKEGCSTSPCGKELHALAFLSGQFAIDVFWGTILSFFNAYMTSKFGASNEFISAVWMAAPAIGIVVGSYAGTLVSNLGETKTANRRWTVGLLGVSVGFLIAGLLVFPKIPYFFNLDVMSADKTTPRYVAAGMFFLLMFLINIVMTCFYSMVGHFKDEAVSKAGLPIWGALGQITVMLLISNFMPGSFEDLDWVFTLFEVASGLIAGFITISILAVMFKDIEEEDQSKSLLDSDNDDKNEGKPKSSSSCCSSFWKGLIKPVTATSTYLAEGGWYYALIIVFGWAAFFSIHPYANDWFARVVYDAVCYDDGRCESEYMTGVMEASKLRLYQQGVQAGSGLLITLIFFAIKKCLKGYLKPGSANPFKSYYMVDSNIARYELVLNVIVQIVYMGIFSAGVFIAGFSGACQVSPPSMTDPQAIRATIGFALTGVGPVILFSAREFQRLFFRTVRNKKTREVRNPDAASSFGKRDGLYDAIVVNLVIQLGQLLPFVLNKFLYAKFGYPILIKMGGGFGCLSLLLTLFSCCPCIRSCYNSTSAIDACCPCYPCGCEEEKEGYEKIRAKPDDFVRSKSTKMGTHVVFRARKTTHHL